MQILGVTFDERMGFRAHMKKFLGQAKIRHCVICRLARCSWGFETNVLRVTHEALLTSITRRGLAAVGSEAYETDLRALETTNTNIAARRISGPGRSGRPGAMFAASDALSVHNLYIRDCATMLDR